MDKQERMCADLAYFIECVHGRKIDPSMIKDTNTIASCKPAMPSDWWVPQQTPMINNQEGEKPMCYKCKSDFTVTSVIGNAAQPTVEATQRDFANNRVWQIRAKHELALREQFFMDSDIMPKTASDLIKAIKEDDFSLDEKALLKHEDDLKYLNCYFGIIWGKNKPDAKGFEAAYGVLKEETQDVIDTITLGTVEEGRQALKDFKLWSFRAKGDQTPGQKAA